MEAKPKCLYRIMLQGILHMQLIKTIKQLNLPNQIKLQQ